MPAICTIYMCKKKEKWTSHSCHCLCPDDTNLPSVPPLQLSIPADYPDQSPHWEDDGQQYGESEPDLCIKCQQCYLKLPFKMQTRLSSQFKWKSIGCETHHFLTFVPQRPTPSCRVCIRTWPLNSFSFLTSTRWQRCWTPGLKAWGRLAFQLLRMYSHQHYQPSIILAPLWNDGNISILSLSFLFTWIIMFCFVQYTKALTVCALLH